MQFHPERSLFEWDPTEDINHAGRTVAASQYFSRFFIAQCRQSTHRYTTIVAETAALIDNYTPLFTFALMGSEMQTYVF